MKAAGEEREAANQVTEDHTLDCFWHCHLFLCFCSPGFPSGPAGATIGQQSACAGHRWGASWVFISLTPLARLRLLEPSRFGSSVAAALVAFCFCSSNSAGILICGLESTPIPLLSS
ncbi:hypothetical protein BDV19DRAFT_238256 [Aspergillus venezuelensis]